MHTLGPFVGMALLGLVAGWVLGRIAYRAVGLLFLAALVFIGLELIGYKMATIHAEALLAHARAAAHQVAHVAKAPHGMSWRLCVYNLPFTLGFILGFWWALPIHGRR